MASSMVRIGDGLRRFDAAAALADQTAKRFTGLPAGLRSGHVLAAFKQASQYLGYPMRVIHLIDALFAWTSADDWLPGQTPIVWPRNEHLAQKLGVGVRQTQKLLDLAVALELITHQDSPNGHRGGQRDEKGRIRWAYGIVLSPLGERYSEFVRVAAVGRIEDDKIRSLRRRLAAARRKIRSIWQAGIDEELHIPFVNETLELALLATTQMKGSRDVVLLKNAVEQIETAASTLVAEYAGLKAQDVVPKTSDNDVYNSPLDAAKFTHSTTTTQLKSAFAEYRNGSAEKRSQSYDVRVYDAQTDVERDLEQHKVDPSFIQEICTGACAGLDQSHPDWGSVISMAERLVDLNAIHRKAWTEACGIMGDKGAAAAVIVTIEKYRNGVVRRPGAYLRGLSEKAMGGALHLGRSFHGLKDLHGTAQATRSNLNARAIDDAVSPLLRNLLSGHAPARPGTPSSIARGRYDDR